MTGLVAQQQCVGPLQLPLADCAVVAQSYFGETGIVTAIGEQCIKVIRYIAMSKYTRLMIVKESVITCSNGSNGGG